GMSEEKDEAQMAQEQAMVDAGHHAGGVDDVEGIVPQMKATPGMPFRQAVARRQERVRHIMHTLPENAQIAIQESLGADGVVDEWSPGDADTDRMYFEAAGFDTGVAK
ncbi:ABC transporter ATP-binding protein, partial [Rhodococcus koreensis]